MITNFIRDFLSQQAFVAVVNYEWVEKNPVGKVYELLELYGMKCK